MITENALKNSTYNQVEKISWLDHLQPGKIDLIDWVIHFGFKGDYDEAIHQQARRAFSNLVLAFPQAKSLLRAAALWSSQGIDGKFPYYGKVPLERKFLRFVREPSEDKRYGYYPFKNTVHLREYQDMGNTLVHELTHALINLTYNNKSKLFFAHDKIKAAEWIDMAEKLNQEVLKNPSTYGCLDFSHYKNSEWPEEMAARGLQYMSFSPDQQLPTSKEISDFLMEEYRDFFSRLDKFIVKPLLDETGMLLLPSLYENEFFKSDDDIFVNKEELVTLKAVKHKRITLLDWKIKKSLDDKIPPSDIINHLKNKNISEDAIWLAAARIGDCALLTSLKNLGYDHLEKSTHTEALTLAAKYNQHATLHFLLELDQIDPSEWSDSDLTAAHYLVAHGNTAGLELLSKKIDFTISNSLGVSLLSLAIAYKQKAALLLLMNLAPELKYFAVKTALSLAVLQNKPEFIEYLAKEFGIKHKDPRLNDALSIAFENKFYDCIRSLLQLGADFNVLTKTNTQNISPLQKIIWLNDEKIIGLLLDENLLADKTGWISLIRASDEMQIITMIKNQKSLVHEKNEEGQTLLHLLILFKRHDLAKKIFETYQADPNIQDNYGASPLDLAKDTRFGVFYLAKCFTATEVKYRVTELPLFWSGENYAPQEEELISIPISIKITELSQP